MVVILRLRRHRRSGSGRRGPAGRRGGPCRRRTGRCRSRTWCRSGRGGRAAPRAAACPGSASTSCGDAVDGEFQHLAPPDRSLRPDANGAGPWPDAGIAGRPAHRTGAYTTACAICGTVTPARAIAASCDNPRPPRGRPFLTHPAQLLNGRIRGLSRSPVRGRDAPSDSSQDGDDRPDCGDGSARPRPLRGGGGPPPRGRARHALGPREADLARAGWSGPSTTSCSASTPQYRAGAGHPAGAARASRWPAPRPSGSPPAVAAAWALCLLATVALATLLTPPLPGAGPGRRSRCARWRRTFMVARGRSRARPGP